MVKLKSGAVVSALGDIFLIAGRDKNFKMNSYNLKAYTDLFNGTLIPVAIMDAEARVQVSNEVVIDAVAKVLGVSDINLIAEEGFPPILLGNAKSQDLYQAIGGATTTERNEKNNSSSKVTINGEVRVGTKRNQKIVINEQLVGSGGEELYRVTIDAAQSTPGMATPSVVSIDVGASIGDSINALKRLRAEYSSLSLIHI